MRGAGAGAARPWGEAWACGGEHTPWGCPGFAVAPGRLRGGKEGSRAGPGL